MIVRRLFYVLGAIALALVFSPILSSSGRSNAQGVDCIANCLERFVACINSSGETPNCDDEYDKCLEECIAIQ